MGSPPTLCALLLATTLLTAACSSAAPAESETIEAGGVHARHMRVRVPSGQADGFEVLMARCAESAQRAGLGEEYDWLCYREQPLHYWLIAFSETRDGFVVPESSNPLRAFVHGVAARGDAHMRAELVERLDMLDVEVEWTLLMRHKLEWSTVESMSTATHPKARLVLWTIEPGQEQAFDAALSAHTAYLRELGYPLPIEGFVVLDGAPGTAMQVVFPRDWGSFHGRESVAAFVGRLTGDEYARAKQLEADLERTLRSSLELDADNRRLASYAGE